MGFSVTSAAGIPSVNTVSSTFNSPGQTLSILSGGSCLIEVTGTWVGSLSVTGAIDAGAFGLFTSAINGASPLTYTYTTITANGLYKVLYSAPFSSIVITASTLTGGSAVITMNSSDAVGAVEAVSLNAANFLTTASQGGTWNTGRTWSLLNSTDSVNAVQSGTWNITNVSGTISLPTGAATSVLQTTGNTSLASIDAGIPAALGQTTMSNSMPIAIASDQSTLPVSMLDTAPSNGTITALDTGTSSLTGANGQVFYFGTPTTNSAAVFNLSSQENVSVQANIIGGGGTLVVEVSMDGGSFWFRPNILQPSTSSYSNAFTSPFMVTVPTAGMTNLRVRSTSSWSGSATIIVRETVNSRNITVTDPLPGITGTISLPTGAATSALQTTGNTSLASIDAGIPAALGQTTMSASMPVTISSDQSAVPASQSGTWNINNISGTISLPTGAATSALQTTGNTSLSSIDTKLTGVSTAANQSTEITSLQLIDNMLGSVGAGTAGTGSALVGAVFNTTSPSLTNGQQAALQSDSTGRLLVSSSSTDGTKTTYSSTITALASAATATDIFTITGSGTKTVRVLRIEISSTQTLASTANILLIKRSAANTGGTSTTPALIPHDSADAAGTATVRAYTANPSALGAAVGTIRVIRLDIPATGSVGSSPVVWTFGDLPGKSVVLRGTAEVLAVSLNSVTLGGGTFDLSIMWTEE